ncbi:MAG: hypothetical protein JNK79_13565 [Chitinophagaceae bacterium]|nr:hypothetical protein [Chitinophagaceae bacterium]
MKQSFYAIGMLMLIAFNQANAQDSRTSLVTRSSVYHSPLSKLDNPSPENSTSVFSNAAVERFRKDFKDVKDVEWMGTKDGYRAYFSKNDIYTAVDYTKKGKLYSVIRYGKKLLTEDIKKMLDDKFDNPQVREVSEVKVADYADIVYIIVVEDKTSMKTVQVMDDEIKVLSELSK